MPETQIPGLQNTSAERRNSKFHKSLDILEFCQSYSRIHVYHLIVVRGFTVGTD